MKYVRTPKNEFAKAPIGENPVEETGPSKNNVEGKTSFNGNHYHEAFWNTKSGNGKTGASLKKNGTDTAVTHYHTITNNRVKTASSGKKHTHKLIKPKKELG